VTYDSPEQTFLAVRPTESRLADFEDTDGRILSATEGTV
jgi:hypothetical protein